MSHSMKASSVAITAGVLTLLLAFQATAVNWTGGGATPSWGDAGNFDGGLGGGTDLKIGTGFASGTTTTLDGNRTLDTLEFTSGSDGVNFVINPGTPGTSVLFPDNRGSGVDAALQMNSSSHHIINAVMRFDGNGGQEHRINGSGGGIIELAGGMQTDSKQFVNLTNDTVLLLSGTATGGARTDINSNAIVRAAQTSNLLGGQINLNGGGGSGGPSNRGGILEITNTAHDFNGKNFRFNGGGFAAVGTDVTLSLNNIDGNGGTTVDGNRGGGPQFGSPYASHTLTFANDILRGNQNSYITSIDGPALIEASLQGELGRGDRVNFNGNGAMQIEGKISSRDNIRINGGAVILATSAQTANNGGSVQNKTFELNNAAISFGADADAALLLAGAQSRANSVLIRDAAVGSATVGGFSDSSSFTGTIDLDDNDVNLYARTSATTSTFSGNINNTGNVTVNDGFNSFAPGEGTVVFDGNKTYEGSTTVKAGTLQIASNVNALGTSGITVESGAELNNLGDLSSTAANILASGTATGDGTYGSLTLQAGGKANAGNSPGIMTIGDFNIADGGIVEVEIVDLSLQSIAGAGTDWDLYDVTNLLNLPLGGEMFVDLLLADPAFLDDDFSIKFLQYQNVANLDLNNFTVRDDQGTAIDGASVTQDGNMLFVDYVAPTVQGAVPEPTTGLLALLALGGLSMRRRR